MRSLLLILLALPSAIRAQPADADDPFRWHEDVDGERSMAWVEAHNAATLAELRADPSFDETYQRALAVITSDERIPAPAIRGEYVFNTWQDAEHPRGIWRRMPLVDYLEGSENWQVLIDLDALSLAEDVEWAWGGSTCLAPDNVRCLVELSPGGSDAAEVREFDVELGAFVGDGFRLPTAKSSVSWIDLDRILVGTETGPGSMTDSGYPRTTRVWRRGATVTDAPLLHEGNAGDVGVWAGVLRSAGQDYTWVTQATDFWNSDRFAAVPDDSEPTGFRLIPLELPTDSSPAIVAGQLIVLLKSDWTVGRATHPQGASSASPTTTSSPARATSRPCSCPTSGRPSTASARPPTCCS